MWDFYKLILFDENLKNTYSSTLVSENKTLRLTLLKQRVPQEEKITELYFYENFFSVEHFA